MKKITKKTMLLAIMFVFCATIMVGFFGGCDRELTLEEYKVNARQELQEYFEELGEDNYIDFHWGFMYSIVIEARAEIDSAVDKAGVNLALTTAKQRLNEIPVRRLTTREMTEQDFEFTITVEETTMPQGENFVFYADLKNISGEDVQIWLGYTVSFLNIDDFTIHPRWLFPPPPNIPVTSPIPPSLLTIKNSESFSQTWHLGSGDNPFVLDSDEIKYFPKGTHTFNFAVIIFLNVESRYEQYINVWSNIIEITVI